MLDMPHRETATMRLRISVVPIPRGAGSLSGNFYEFYRGDKRIVVGPNALCGHMCRRWMIKKACCACDPENKACDVCAWRDE